MKSLDAIKIQLLYLMYFIISIKQLRQGNDSCYIYVWESILKYPTHNNNIRDIVKNYVTSEGGVGGSHATTYIFNNLPSTPVSCVLCKRR